MPGNQVSLEGTILKKLRGSKKKKKEEEEEKKEKEEEGGGGGEGPLFGFHFQLITYFHFFSHSQILFSPFLFG